MNRKLLCSILSATLVCSVFPAVVMAAEPTYTLAHSLDFRNQNTDISDNGWDWDAEEKILTLNDFSYSIPEGAIENAPVFHLPDDSMIYIEGEDNILENHSYHCDVFYCEGNIIVSGDGKLNISIDNHGSSVFFVEQGPILFNDEVTITAESKGYLIYLENARGNKPVISVKDDAKLIFKKEDHKERNILLTKKSNVETSPNWLNYTEITDEEDSDYIQLVTKQASPEKPVQKPEAPVSPLNEYKIMIGNTDIVKNNKVSYVSDAVPYLNKDGYTMLPLRALLEVSNPEQKVTWNNSTKSAHTFVNEKQISIRPNDPAYTKETEKIALRTPAETVNGRLFVSLRDWMNIMEIDVSQMNWDAATQTITMKY